jgi:predicted RNA-binding Zn-ribbon protein involved in translation (DUF1610 family)
MGIAVFAILLVAAAVILIRGAMAQFVCPFCGGTLARAFEKMQCTGCGRLVFMWQAKRRRH